MVEGAHSDCKGRLPEYNVDYINTVLTSGGGGETTNHQRFKSKGVRYMASVLKIIDLILSSYYQFVKL